MEVGQEALLRGQFEKASWALDAALYLDSADPGCSPAPSLWQRGLACYYGGHYQEGASQFACDMSENGSDVEEVVWHFLCRSACLGHREALSEGLLPLRTPSPSPSSSSDSSPQAIPPPMQQVLDLYKGTGSAEVVLSAATSPDSAPVRSYNDTNALAYAHFYIGLHHETRGDSARAREHFRVAAECRNPDFMGRLMVTHFKLFCRRFPQAVTGPSHPQPHPHPQLRLIQGGWQLSQGHLVTTQGSKQYRSDLVRSLLRAVDMGVRCFDCGDIYTGVEELYGRALRAHCLRGGRPDDIRIHTKLVPDLDVIRNGGVDAAYMESVVHRSLNRLGVARLDLVQLHWWDNSVSGSLEALRVLGELVQRGLVREIGLTNFDTATTWSFIDAGIKIASTQVSLCAVRMDTIAAVPS